MACIQSQPYGRYSSLLSIRSVALRFIFKIISHQPAIQKRQIRNFVSAFTVDPMTIRHLSRTSRIDDSGLRYYSLLQLLQRKVKSPQHSISCYRLSPSSCRQMISQLSENDDNTRTYDSSLFDTNVPDFHTLGIRSPILLERLQQQQLCRPTKVQAASFQAIIQSTTPLSTSSISESAAIDDTIPTVPPRTTSDVTIACETGSGKTLAYLLPLLDDILQRKQEAVANAKIISNGKNNNIEQHSTIIDVGYDYARAIILVPNKELVQQVVRMAAPLSGGGRYCLVYGGHTLPDPSKLDATTTSYTSIDSDNNTPLPQDIVRIAIMPGGLNEPLDFAPFRQTVAIGGGTQPPLDLIITTPAAIGPLALSPKHIAFFADIQTIVIDEADMLLDGGYIRALENVLMGFKRADRLDAVRMGEVPKTQHVFVAATLPNYGLRSVDAYLNKKFPNAKRIELDSLHMAKHSGLVKPTVWMEIESKKERMMTLVELFESNDESSLRNEKVMIFLNSVADCEASCEALQKAGVRCLPYHAQIPISERTIILDRFRRHNAKSNYDLSDQSGAAESLNVNDDIESVPVLVCTDLASRGLDVPGVSVVVQLQFCGNVVGHLHRMGRCGRGGNERQYGYGYVFYGIKERALVETVKAAELEQEQMILPGDVATEDWDESSSGNMDYTSTDQSGITSDKGKVTTAFSRKRGFTKKLKKLRRDEQITQGE
jgi:superfamily II DNA/RNA helicase